MFDDDLINKYTRLSSRVKGSYMWKENGLEIYHLHLQLKYIDEEKKLRRYEVGSRRFDRNMCQLLLLGMAQSGKTMFLNNIVNYLYRVKPKDDFRLKAVVDESEEHVKSWVTCYTFWWNEKFPIDFGLTIVDTPGFSEKSLQETTYQISELFTSRSAYPSQMLTSIGLVMRGHQQLLSGSEKWIFDHILGLISKDMDCNISFISTFFNNELLSILDVMKEDGIDVADERICQMDSSIIFELATTEPEMYLWYRLQGKLKKFLDSIATLPSVSLAETKQILHQRQLHLRTSAYFEIEALKGLSKLEHIIFKLYRKDRCPASQAMVLFRDYHNTKHQMLSYIERVHDCADKINALAVCPFKLQIHADNIRQNISLESSKSVESNRENRIELLQHILTMDKLLSDYRTESTAGEQWQFNEALDQLMDSSRTTSMESLYTPVSLLSEYEAEVGREIGKLYLNETSS